MPLSVSTSTTVRTNRPQWQPLAWRSGASSGTVTVVARMSEIFIVAPSRLLLRHAPPLLQLQQPAVAFLGAHVLAEHAAEGPEVAGVVGEVPPGDGAHVGLAV